MGLAYNLYLDSTKIFGCKNCIQRGVPEFGLYHFAIAIQPCRVSSGADLATRLVLALNHSEVAASPCSTTSSGIEAILSKTSSRTGACDGSKGNGVPSVPSRRDTESGPGLGIAREMTGVMKWIKVRKMVKMVTESILVDVSKEVGYQLKRRWTDSFC
jgi:hypothetical protein